MKVDSRIGWASAGQMRTEPSPIKRQRMNRAPLFRTTGAIGMVIRIIFAEGELDLGIRLEEADHRPGIVEKRVNTGLVEMIPGFMLNIGSRVLDGIVDPGALGERVSRHP